MFKLVVLLALSAAVINAWNPPTFKQCDSRWAHETLGYGPDTICQAGCLMTSVTSMVAGCGHNYNPSTMNSWLKAHGGFQGDLYVWGPIKEFGFNYQGQITGTAAIRAAVTAGKRVILNVNNGHHWVLALKDTGSGFDVMDPGYNTKHYAYSDVVRAGIYSAGCS